MKNLLKPLFSILFLSLSIAVVSAQQSPAITIEKPAITQVEWRYGVELPEMKSGDVYNLINVNLTGFNELQLEDIKTWTGRLSSNVALMKYNDDSTISITLKGEESKDRSNLLKDCLVKLSRRIN